jgi:hypothetical protein
MDEYLFRFTDLSKKAQQTAIQEFIIDSRLFAREDADGVIWPRNEEEARKILEESDIKFDKKGLPEKGMFS